MVPISTLINMHRPKAKKWKQAVPRIRRSVLRTRAGPFQQIDCATAQTRSAFFQPTWSAMLSTPISQTQPGRSSFMRIKLRGILRCATVSTFQTTPIAGCKQEMRSWSVTVVVCILCLVWRYRLRLCWSAYRRGGLFFFFPPPRVKCRHLVGEKCKAFCILKHGPEVTNTGSTDRLRGQVKGLGSEEHQSDCW